MEEKKKRGRPKKIVEQKLGETEMALKEENLIKKNEAEKIEKIDETEKNQQEFKNSEKFLQDKNFQEKHQEEEMIKDILSKNVTTLKKMAKEYKIEGFSGMAKSDLINAILIKKKEKLTDSENSTL